MTCGKEMAVALCPLQREEGPTAPPASCVERCCKTETKIKDSEILANPRKIQNGNFVNRRRKIQRVWERAQSSAAFGFSEH